MAKIEEITKEYLQQFREDFAEHVKPFEEKYGIKLSLHNMSGNKEAFHTKMMVELEGVEPEHVRNWNAGYYRKHGLVDSHLGMELHVKTKTGTVHLKVIGCERQKLKCPIKAEVLGGESLRPVGSIVGIAASTVLERGAHLSKEIGIID